MSNEFNPKELTEAIAKDMARLYPNEKYAHAQGLNGGVTLTSTGDWDGRGTLYIPEWWIDSKHPEFYNARGYIAANLPALVAETMASFQDSYEDQLRAGPDRPLLAQLMIEIPKPFGLLHVAKEMVQWYAMKRYSEITSGR